MVFIDIFVNGRKILQCSVGTKLQPYGLEMSATKIFSHEN